MVGKRTTLYIDYILTSISENAEIIETLVSAAPEDKVDIYLNSSGGDIAAAEAICAAITASEAFVTVHLFGVCASAATLIPLAVVAKDANTDNGCLVVHDSAKMLIHKVSLECIEVPKAVEVCLEAANEQFLRKQYDLFLWPSEFDAIRLGGTIVLASEQIKDKIRNYEINLEKNHNKNT